METALPSELVRTTLALMRGIGSPLADSISEMVRVGNGRGIAESKASPSSYTDATSYYKDAVASSFLRKLEELPTGIDKAAVARRKWREAEDMCYRTNQRLTRYLPEFSNSADSDERIADFLSAVRKEIVSWIGFSPPEFVDGRFGPGATYSDRGGKTTHIHKMSSDPTLTSSAIWFLPQWYGTKWGALTASAGKLVFVPGNRFTTVPKDAKTDRAISVEPAINVFYQLGLGRVLRERLRSNAAWDLDRAQDVHRRVACSASASRAYCTLDLTSASDTVAKNLVRILLPPLWYSQLDDLRSKKTLDGDKWILLEKFSSMGNGYTFELETIIFAAITCITTRRCGHAGVLGKDVFVFGDDIIAPDNVYGTLCTVLEFLGFLPNKEKSFHGETPFRESCGGDYWDGRDVRPVFVKQVPRNPLDLFVLANQISQLCSRFESLGVRLDRRCWFTVLDCIPTPLRRLRGPQALGDLVIWDTEAAWDTFQEHGIRYVRCLTVRPSRDAMILYRGKHPDLVLACATYGSGGGIAGGLTPRDSPLEFRVAWVAYS